MNNKCTRFLCINFIWLGALLVSGCTADLPTYAERPWATSTPDLSAPISPIPSIIDIPVVTMTVPLSATETLVDMDIRQLSTEEQLALVDLPIRDLRDLAVRLKPDVDEVPLVVNAETPSYAIGDRLNFWVHNIAYDANEEIEASLIHKTDVVYAWVEAEQDFDQEALIRSIDQFSQHIYPHIREAFGSEANPGVDNDPRLHILHSVSMGRGVAGYYSSADEYSRLVNPFSNEKEMFYINLLWLNSSRNYENYETVLAHELQHMIHWANDQNEETWLNEGLSEFAKEVVGYASDTTFIRSFTNQPDTQLNAWNEISNGNAAHYGSSNLMVLYLDQRFGRSFIESLVDHPANGIGSIESLLADFGIAQDFNMLFADWVVANYADDPNALGLDGIYGYHNLAVPAPALAETYVQFPVEENASVHNYGTRYILLKPDDEAADGLLTIEFKGEAETRLIDTDIYSGSYAWWSNRGDDSNSRLTRQFDLTTLTSGTPVEMDVAMWWDIEDDYDYGYVLVSQDGEKWDILEGQQTTSENPSGNSFGFAYTGLSRAENGEGPAWVKERYDLSRYAGQTIWVRFEYVTDDGVNTEGWIIDDLSIPAIGYFTDFEDGIAEWESEGWLLTTNQLRQEWLLQVLTFEDNILVDVHRAPVVDGVATVDVDLLETGKTAVLAISGLTPNVTREADYHLLIRR